MPAPGLIDDLVLPSGPGIRVDSGVAKGFEVPRFYDPMIAKIVAWGQNREQARLRLLRALEDTAIKGVTTNTEFLRSLLVEGDFISGDYSTDSISEMRARPSAEVGKEIEEAAIVGAVINQFRRDKRSRTTMRARQTERTSDWRGVTWRWGGR